VLWRRLRCSPSRWGRATDRRVGVFSAVEHAPKCGGAESKCPTGSGKQSGLPGWTEFIQAIRITFGGPAAPCAKVGGLHGQRGREESARGGVAQIHLLQTQLGEARARDFLDKYHSQLKTDPGSLRQFLKTEFEGIAAELKNRRQQAVAHSSDIIVARVLETSTVGHGSNRVEVSFQIEPIRSLKGTNSLSGAWVTCLAQPDQPDFGPDSETSLRRQDERIFILTNRILLRLESLDHESAIKNLIKGEN
jgi:hypothetical protein